MWDQVKPITLLLDQLNDDGSRFLMNFYSHDYKLVKLKEATHLSEFGEILETYSRLYDNHEVAPPSLNYFVSRLNKDSVSKLIQYYENKNLLIEYMF